MGPLAAMFLAVALVGGEVDEGDPAVAALTIDDQVFCTGTLVSPRAVLTAAHCVRDLETAAPLEVAFGAPSVGPVRIAVQRVLVHPAYRASQPGADLALLELEHEPAGIAVVALARSPEEVTALREVRHVGFGVDASGHGEGTKRTGTHAVRGVTAAEIESGSIDGRPCFGDSGGPALDELSAGAVRLVGVVSRAAPGDRGCDGDRTWDTRVDVHAAWIDASLASWDADESAGSSASSGCNMGAARSGAGTWLFAVVLGVSAMFGWSRTRRDRGLLENEKNMNAGQPQLVPGTVLGGRYRLVRVLGSGGMGAVYEAVQLDLGRTVAVKVLHPHLANQPDLIERFRREAQAAGALGHPHIVQVTDFHPGDPAFLVMEHLSGASLRQVLKQSGPLPLERVVRIFTQVLSALSAAHAAQIVHRDIKPDNIFLSSSSAMEDMVTVLDFGVAKLLDEPDVTSTGALIGTLSYMAPEQARGVEVDARTDIYAVAACMYHAISGRRPFEGSGNADLIAKIVLHEPPALPSLRPDVDTGLAAIVQRGLAKPPQERFQSAAEMTEALQAWLGGARAAPKTTAMMAMPTAAGAPATPATGDLATSHGGRTSHAGPQPAPPPAYAPAPYYSPAAFAPTAPAVFANATPGYAPSPTLVSARTSRSGGGSSALVIGAIVVGAVLLLGAVVAVGAFALMARSSAVAVDIDAGISTPTPVTTTTAGTLATSTSSGTPLRPTTGGGRVTPTKVVPGADAAVAVAQPTVADAGVAPGAGATATPTAAPTGPAVSFAKLSQFDPKTRAPRGTCTVSKDCRADEACKSGQCICEFPAFRCSADGRCMQNGDATNCGECGVVCKADAICSVHGTPAASICSQCNGNSPTTCDQKRCTNLNDDFTNCGACGKKCNQSERCQRGECK